MKPSQALLESLSKDEEPESGATKVKIEIDQQPDWKALGEPLLSAVKANDAERVAKAVAAICMSCAELPEDEDEDSMSD
jgi:hypothetical protein